MLKPRGYDDVKVGGGYTPPALGGHHMVVHQVQERKNKNGGEMIVVFFDFAPNDSQPGLFADQYKNDQRPERKWPLAGRHYINVYTDNGECSRDIKGFITSVEKSNNITVQWGDNFAAQFKGRRVGGVFGEVEEEYNNKKNMRNRIRWYCEDARAGEMKIPKPKYLDKKQEEQFMKIPASAEDLGLPFN